MSSALGLVGGLAAGMGAMWITARIVDRYLTRPETEIYSFYLFVAALIYLAFAWGEGAPWIWVEWAGVAVFGAWAWAGRHRPMWIAAGWLVHGGWDIWIHGAHTPFVPDWYRLLCFGFDLAVAWWLFRRVSVERA